MSDTFKMDGDYDSLPRAKMQRIEIAFDIDGTLRCNCTDTCRDVNVNILNLAIALNSMKNTRLWAWSGGGKKYVEDFIHTNDALSAIFIDAHCVSKFSGMKPHIAIDDIQDTALGDINLIVREK